MGGIGAIGGMGGIGGPEKPGKSMSSGMPPRLCLHLLLDASLELTLETVVLAAVPGHACARSSSSISRGRRGRGSRQTAFGSGPGQRRRRRPSLRDLPRCRSMLLLTSTVTPVDDSMDRSPLTVSMVCSGPTREARLELDVPADRARVEPTR